MRTTSYSINYSEEPGENEITGCFYMNIGLVTLGSIYYITVKIIINK